MTHSPAALDVVPAVRVPVQPQLQRRDGARGRRRTRRGRTGRAARRAPAGLSSLYRRVGGRLGPGRPPQRQALADEHRADVGPAAAGADGDDAHSAGAPDMLSGSSAASRTRPLARRTSRSTRSVASTPWQSPSRWRAEYGGQLHRLHAGEADPARAPSCRRSRRRRRTCRRRRRRAPWPSRPRSPGRAAPTTHAPRFACAAAGASARAQRSEQQGWEQTAHDQARTRSRSREVAAPSTAGAPPQARVAPRGTPPRRAAASAGAGCASTPARAPRRARRGSPRASGAPTRGRAGRGSGRGSRRR